MDMALSSAMVCVRCCTTKVYTARIRIMAEQMLTPIFKPIFMFLNMHASSAGCLYKKDEV
jgi:hypothetical protein